MSNNQLISDKSYVMPFGKHNGKTIQTLIDEGESQYLLWAHDDEQYVPWFELGHILYDEVADKL